MSEIEIAKYGTWFFQKNLTAELMDKLKHFAETEEIDGFDYVKSKLNENLKLIIDKTAQLTNKINSQSAQQLFYTFYFNRFLFYLTMDAIIIPREQKYDFPIRGIFLHYEPNGKYSIDKLAVKQWFAEELTIPHLMMGFMKSVSSKLISALFDKANKEKFTKSFNEEMMKPLSQIEDPEKIDLIEKIRISRDILIKENNKNPYALTQICKKMSERYGMIPYNTLRDKMKRFNIPVDINKFTKIYG